MSQIPVNVIEFNTKLISRLPECIQAALEWYAHTGERIVNPKLRQGLPLSPEEARRVQLIDQAFTYMLPLQEPLIVYRGIKEDYLDIPHQYISTSTDRIVAEGFTRRGCCVLEILLPVGSQVIPISAVSQYSYEDEILLPRTGRFEVTGERGGRYKTYELDFYPGK